MNHAQIAEILDRYWEGETTIVEERRLKEYFAAGVIDDRFRDVAPLFLALNDAHQVNAPVHLGKGISSAPMRVVGFSTWKQYMAAAVLTGIIAIGGWMYFNHDEQMIASNEVVTAPPAPPAATTAQQPKYPVALAMTTPKAVKPVKRKKPASTALTNPTPPEESTYTEAEALQAAEEIKAALALVSRKLKKGKNDATKNLNKVEIMDHYFKQG